MPMYRVDFNYTEIMFGDVELLADSPEDAEDAAASYIERTYPEATDVEIEQVKVLDGQD